MLGCFLSLGFSIVAGIIVIVSAVFDVTVVTAKTQIVVIFIIVVLDIFSIRVSCTTYIGSGAGQRPG